MLWLGWIKSAVSRMSSICLLDTSIFLNILDVPNRNRERAEVLDKFAEYIELGCRFIIPMATVIETGNHIAQNGDGNIRRAVAQLFVDTLEQTFTNTAPFRISEWDSQHQIRQWMKAFPAHAQRNKSASRTGEGTSFGDLSIIKEFERTCSKFPMSEVFIWSLDEDLSAYHQGQPKPAP
ncbi:hypothetical protein EC844_10660 [Acinetobacter calcoaceticus]|uniref:Cyclic nucleotide-binding domain-containing protein n=1 Tax=Acinetobacter calcoaceticus TaxID=471 RepID=A0A4V2R1C5_ACICA|nr:hypothetical protein EC844_10660 [Acinetobacter calcoaceticus]